MSAVQACDQCVAITSRGHRCKNRTCRSKYCHVHLAKLGFKIAPSQIPDSGLGLYYVGAQDIRPNTIIPGLEYTGKRSRTKIGGDYVLELVGENSSSPLWVDGAKTNSSALRFANDCRPKDRRDGTCVEVAKFAAGRNAHGRVAKAKTVRTLHPRDEITVSYGADYWRHKEMHRQAVKTVAR
jgi:hypothetical protein